MMNWYKKEEIAGLISWENHAFAWNIFIHGVRSMGEDGYLVNS